jgi:hypothetical protein
MKDLKLSEILRYLATGIVILLVFYFCAPNKVAEVLSKFDAIEKPFILFVVGSIAFLLYRTFIYYLILFYILDKIVKDNVRDQLMQYYNINKRHEAELVWRFISKHVFSKEYIDFDIQSSEVHLLYISSITSLFGSLYLFFSNLNSLEEKYVMILILFGISISSILAALLYDFRTEKIISMILMSRDKINLPEQMSKLGYNQRNNNIKEN